MRPFETIARAQTPEKKELTLHHHDGDFYIHLDGEELMSTRRHGSEAALAEIGCKNLQTADSARVLIGGLGLGYTLRAALRVLPRTAEVVVSELFGPVVDWNRSHLKSLYPKRSESLLDPRVTIRQQDVRTVIEDPNDAPFHAILLDVDNGPSAWCLRSNSRIYERHGLLRIKSRLVEGGVLAVWSAYSDSAFVKMLGKCGFKDAHAVGARSQRTKGQKHTIFLGTAPRKGTPAAPHSSEAKTPDRSSGFKKGRSRPRS